MSTSNDIVSFIVTEFNKLKTINNFLETLKQETIDQINATYGTSYTLNDFYLTTAIDNASTSTPTEGYYSEGYTSSCYYSLFSINPLITVTANVYVNGVNSFVMDITPNGLVPVA